MLIYQEIDMLDVILGNPILAAMSILGVMLWVGSLRAERGRRPVAARAHRRWR